MCLKVQNDNNNNKKIYLICVMTKSIVCNGGTLKYFLGAINNFNIFTSVQTIC